MSRKTKSYRASRPNPLWSLGLLQHILENGHDFPNGTTSICHSKLLSFGAASEHDENQASELHLIPAKLYAPQKGMPFFFGKLV